MKRFASLCLLILSCSLAATAQKGITVYTVTDPNTGLERMYEVYEPQVLSNQMIVVLPGTTIALPSNPPLGVYHNMALDMQSELYGFLSVEAISTYNTISKSFYWESIGTDSFFPVDPKDSDFLAALIVYLQNKYGFTNKASVLGFSSGAMMAARFCAEHSELVAACAILSGNIYVNGASANLPQPANPVSIIELHGDLDTTIYYCGGLFHGWAHGLVATPSLDVDVQYWKNADGFQTATPTFCNGSIPSTVLSIDLVSDDHQTEIIVMKEINLGHNWKQVTIGLAVQFLLSHSKPMSPPVVVTVLDPHSLQR